MNAEITREAATEAADWAATLPHVKTLTIENRNDFDLASEAVKHARSNWKRLEARRTAVTRPLLEAKNGVDALFKPALDLIKEIESILKTKIGEYIAAQKSAQVQAMHSVGAAAQAGASDLVVGISEVPTSKGITVKSVWEPEIMDPDIVPRDLCSPDLNKINERIRYADTVDNPPLPIPGVRFTLKTSVSVRVK